MVEALNTLGDELNENFKYMSFQAIWDVVGELAEEHDWISNVVRLVASMHLAEFNPSQLMSMKECARPVYEALRGNIYKCFAIKAVQEHVDKYGEDCRMKDEG